jgi:AraC-like DNA-binding protein
MPQRLYAALEATRAWSNYFQSDDLDEVRAFIGQKDGPNTRVAQGKEPLGYSIYQLKGHHTIVGASESATPQVVRGNVTGSVFLLQVPTGTLYQAGRRRHGPTTATSVVTAPPMWLYTRTSPPGRLVGVEVQQRALLAELSARREQSASKLTQHLAVMQVRADEYERLLEAVSCLIQAMWPGTPAKVLAMAEAAFIDLAAGLALRESVGQRPGDLSIERARQLEDWIEAHLSEPITMGGLCEVAGVGGRSLQKSFMHRRGISPMRYVLERRLVAVHHALLHPSGNAPVNVTRIAMDLGFTHLGRFANVYRQVIGELPSETLAGPQA